jgi:hypothetical protein
LRRPVFEARRVAYFETEGWRAYYDRRWLRLAWLLVSLCHEQFAMSWPDSVLAAYYAGRASAAWVPVDHDAARVQDFYARFYRLARRASHATFDPEVVAALELRYNDDHRRFSGNPDNGPLVETLARLHEALFLVPADVATASARERANALLLVDGITSSRSTDIEGDWRRIAARLEACYATIATSLAHCPARSMA